MSLCLGIFFLEQLLYLFSRACESFLTQFDELFCALQLLCELVDVKVVVFHLLYDGLQLLKGFFVFHGG